MPHIFLPSRSTLILILSLFSLACLVLLLGKLIWLPLALIGPHSWGEDAYIGVASYIQVSSVKSLYCVDSLRTACRISEEPLGLGSLAYRLVASIPFTAWILIMALAVISSLGACILARDSSVTVFATLTLALMVVNAGAIGSLYVNQEPLTHAYPRVELEDMRLEYSVEGSTLHVKLKLGLFKLESALCTLEGGHVAETTTRDNEVIASIPRDYFEWLYQVKSREKPYLPRPPALIYDSIKASCVIELDKGRLEGRYIASFTWKEPELTARGSSISIANENPVGLEVRIEIVDKARLTIAWREVVELNPASIYVLNLSDILPGGVYDVRIVYSFLGSERSQVVEVAVG